MKKTIKITALAFVVFFSLQKNVSDAELTTQSTTAISAYPKIPQLEVKDGVAHLSGNFASEIKKAIAAIKNIKIWIWQV